GPPSAIPTPDSPSPRVDRGVRSSPNRAAPLAPKSVPPTVPCICPRRSRSRRPAAPCPTRPRSTGRRTLGQSAAPVGRAGQDDLRAVPGALLLVQPIDLRGLVL